jgi:cytochrome P450
MLAMVDIMRGARVRLTMGKFLFLHRDPKWYESIRLVHNFMDQYIDRAYDELAQLEEKGEKSEEKSERTDLLWDMVHKIPPEDRILLRDQITAVWVPSNETTSIHISNAIYQLARHPEAWEKLQKEVLELGDEELTFSKLRGMKYMNWIINESKFEHS